MAHGLRAIDRLVSDYPILHYDHLTAPSKPLELWGMICDILVHPDEDFDERMLALRGLMHLGITSRLAAMPLVYMSYTVDSHSSYEFLVSMAYSCQILVKRCGVIFGECEELYRHRVAGLGHALPNLKCLTISIPQHALKTFLGHDMISGFYPLGRTVTSLYLVVLPTTPWRDLRACDIRRWRTFWMWFENLRDLEMLFACKGNARVPRLPHMALPALTTLHCDVASSAGKMMARIHVYAHRLTKAHR